MYQGVGKVLSRYTAGKVRGDVACKGLSSAWGLQGLWVLLSFWVGLTRVGRLLYMEVKWWAGLLSLGGLL